MKRLRRYLEQRQITQAQLAQRVGVTQPTVSGWLSGEFKPSLETIVVLSKETGMSVEELVRDAA